VVAKENVEIARRSYEAWNRGDLDAWLEAAHPDIEFRTAQLFSDTEGVYRGIDGMRKFWETFRDPWESIQIEIEHLDAIGDDRVLGLVWFRGRGLGSGAEASIQYANLSSFDNGQVTLVIGFSDWDQARKAAGLSD
jgi:ketosteroid isomerase-like protein